MVIKGDSCTIQTSAGNLAKNRGAQGRLHWGQFHSFSVDEAKRWPVTEGLAWVKEEGGVSDEEVWKAMESNLCFPEVLGHPERENQRWQVQTLDS